MSDLGFVLRWWWEVLEGVWPWHDGMGGIRRCLTLVWFWNVLEQVRDLGFDLFGSVSIHQCVPGFLKVHGGWTDVSYHDGFTVATQSILQQPCQLAVSIVHISWLVFLTCKDKCTKIIWTELILQEILLHLWKSQLKLTNIVFVSEQDVNNRNRMIT